MSRALVLALLVILIPGCTREMPKNKRAPSGDGASYDPKEDPLVNVPSLFEPFPEQNPERANTDEVLVRHLPASPKTLNPIFSSSVYESYMSSLLFDSLFTFDSTMQWMVNQKVVDSFKESDDHLVNTVRLRPGLKWHDGHPWTAEDVRFSWEAILDENVPCPAMKTGTDQIADVKVLDELTVQFIHREALATNKWNMLFYVIPKHIYGRPDKRKEDPSLQKSDYYNHHNRDEVVGNGPYRLVKWISNDRIEVERWEDYHGERPHFKRQVLKIQTDQNTALLLFKKGLLDEMQLSPQQFATQTNGADFKKYGYKALAPQWSFYCMGWNMDGSNPFFNDVRVRRAMTHAINIPDLIDKIHYNLVTPCHGIYHPDSWMYNKTIKLLKFDLEEAAHLLDEAGWKVDPADGWRYKTIQGTKTKFRFELLMPKENPWISKVASIIQEDLKKVGVQLEQRNIEWVTMSQVTRKHEFQAAAWGWGTGADPDTGWNLWHSSEYDKGRNYVGFRNDRVDKLFALGRTEFDQQKRAQYYAQIQKIIYDEQPYTFLWNRGTLWAFSKRLRGISFSPRGVFGFNPSHMAWWVPASDTVSDSTGK